MKLIKIIIAWLHTFKKAECACGAELRTGEYICDYCLCNIEDPNSDDYISDWVELKNNQEPMLDWDPEEIDDMEYHLPISEE